MIIKIIMGCYLIFLLLISYYLWHQRNKQFLIYNSKVTKNFQAILSWTALIILLEVIFGFCLLFLFNKYSNLITLILSVVTLSIFTAIINKKSK